MIPNSTHSNKKGATSSSNRKVIKKLNKKRVALAVIVVLLFLFILIYLLQPDHSTKSDFPSSSNNPQEEVDEWEKLAQELSFFKKEYKSRYLSYQKLHPDLDLERVVVLVNIGLDRKFYTEVIPSPNQNTDTILVNKYHFLTEDYVPKNLQNISSKYSAGTRKMEASAKNAFESMAKDAQTEGYTIRAVSTYRNFNYQKNLYNNYAKSDGTEQADTYSARAGYSEHQTGLAVDVDNNKKSYTSFGDTEEFNWMKENAYKYGFILRYTKENEPITGYKDEPWHYRYVGVEIATYIQNHPMTYEEYYVRFLEK